MALTPSTRLGVYQITAPIGEGGMGQVYRARDTKLDRDVAIKILPEAFAHDADRLARFEREAKTLASLNHPHIAAIYGLEESPSAPSTSSGQAGVTALVMELVEGDDLSQRIARGAIPLDEALPIATQMAEALEAAHEQGIIHRDLKPANIKVRSDGTVKVLDFGLAKAMDSGTGSAGRAGGAHLTQSPTITTPAMTQAAMTSPDGHWPAYQSNESGRFEISVRPFPNVDAGHWTISTSGGTRPLWARSGTELFYLDGVGAMTRVPIQTAPTFSAGTPTTLFDTRSYTGVLGRAYDVSPDGQQFLMIKAAGTEQAPSMVVVLNWLEELKATLPAK